MSKKLTLEKISTFVSQNSTCELLSLEYTNNKTALEIRCSCGEVFLKTFDAFMSGQRQCSKCSKKIHLNKVTFNIDFVRDYIHNNSSSILISSEYINARKLLDIICSCGESFTTNFDKFKNQNKRQCNKCSGVYKPNYNEVKIDIEKHGCILISTSYANKRMKLDIVCPCGTHFSCTYEHFKIKELKVCSLCVYEKSNGSKRHTIKEVKTFIIENDCIPLFKTYKNNKQKLSILCNCGEQFTKSFHDFKNGNQRRCIRCANIMSLGEFEIEKVLNSNKIPFIFQYTINNCRNKNPLPFDFAIFSDDSKTKLNYLIEFQGQQHYQVVDFGGKGLSYAENAFSQGKKNDKIKYDYCIKNGIKLILIPYWQYSNIEKILLESLEIYAQCASV